MGKYNKKLLLCLGLFGLLSVTACGPTSNPTSNPTTNPTTTTTSPTTTVPTTTTSDQPTTPDKGVLEGEVPAGHIYNVGDQFYDFSLTSTLNETYVLSEVLKEKKLVVVNFFASWCGPCVAELPVMQEVYEEYKEDVEIIAMSAEMSDTLTLLHSKFVEKMNLTFPVGLDITDLYSHFRATGIPVSVIIDRYGTITEIHHTSIPYKSDWVKIFTKYLADNYVQPDFDNPVDPDQPDEPEGPQKPDKTMPSSSEIEAAINDSSYPFGYMNAPESDIEYNWPWLIDSKTNSIYPSNSGIDGSYSIIRSQFEVTDPENNVLAFDYTSSTEKNYDALYVLIDGVIVQKISGSVRDWKTCYAYVPTEEGSYELTLIYQKDSESSVGDDIVHVKNMRFVSVDEIVEDMYIQRPAATKYDENTKKYTKYVDLVLNNEDGYYHVESADGPLLLAELINATRWSDELTPFLVVSNGGSVIDGIDYYDVVIEYCAYAQNNGTGLTPVSEELKDALVAITNKYGDDPSENQWKELCYYYSAYGPTAEEFPSPIVGLTVKDPIKGEVGEPISVTFDTIVVPRGKYIEFTPTETGAYSFTTDTITGTFGSVYDENFELIVQSTDYTYNKITAEEPDLNIEMYAYLEANKTYYFRVAYSVVEELGTFTVLIDKVGETHEQLLLASDSTAFTTDGEDFDLEGEVGIISRNIPYEIDEDGYYRHVRKDGTLGSYVYADFISNSSMFFSYGKPISIKKLVELGGANLDWGVNEDAPDTETGVEDLTEEFEYYIELSESQESPLIPVDIELAGLLQKLMDYYSFYGVKDSWMKLCFYYEYFGPSSK